MAVGSAIQAAVGIGLALVVVPILALIDPGFIPGPMLLAGVVLTAITAYRERDAIDKPGLRLSLAGLAVGTLVGAIALKFVSGAQLPRVFGILVLLAVFLSVSRLRVEASTRALLLGGGAAGIMGTMVGIHGPPISLVFQNSDPRIARAMLGAFFSVGYLATVAALVAFDLFGRAELARAAVLLPGVIVGLVVAPHIGQLFDSKRLRLAILGLATVSGLLLILR
jgi:uncharacterized protein